MKLKPKHMASPIKEIRLPIRQNLVDLRNHLNSVLIDRSVAVNAIILGLLTQQHVMLEGPPGGAKSLLAESVFRAISGATLFEKQLMKGTKPEEVFGPLNLAKYQKDSVWEHNITGKLPDCHFAFLDEVFRASDMLLPGCLGILNERKFENGGKQVHCPLISAVGTTNFTTDSNELLAFNDRWLLWINITPLTSVNSRIRMLNGFLERLEAQPPRKEFLTLDGLKTAIQEVRQVEVPKELAAAYASLCSNLSTALGEPVSDRRFCQAIRLAQAQAYLNNLEVVDAQCLAETAFGLIKRGDEKCEAAFASAYEKSVGALEKVKVEDSEMIKLEDIMTKLASAYSEKIGPERKQKLTSKVEEFVGMLAQRDEDFASQDAEKAFLDIRAKADSLLLTLREGANTRVTNMLGDPEDSFGAPTKTTGRPTLADLVQSSRANP